MTKYNIEEIIKKLSEQGLFEEFFGLILTKEEAIHIKNRLIIIEELISGNKTQRQIAKEHNLSIAQITRGSNELKGISQELLGALKKYL